MSGDTCIVDEVVHGNLNTVDDNEITGFGPCVSDSHCHWMHTCVNAVIVLQP